MNYLKLFSTFFEMNQINLYSHIAFFVLLLLGICCGSFKASGQCSTTLDGVTFKNTLDITNQWQTVECVAGGDYFDFNAQAGTVYLFSFCQGGGDAQYGQTELSINFPDGTIEPTGYNDFGCGTSAELYWAAPTTGNYQLLVTQDGCRANNACNILAYQIFDDAPGSHCGNPITINNNNFTQSGLSTCGMGNFYTSSNTCNSYYMNAEEVVFEFTPSSSNCYLFTLNNSDRHTGLFLLDGCPNEAETNCIEGSAFNNGDPLLNATLQAGQTYYILVDINPYNSGSFCTDFDFEMQVCEPTIEVDNSGNYSQADYLVEEVFITGCTPINNASISGNSNAIGYFNNGTFGIEEGIVLSTGSIFNVGGPNTKLDLSTNWLGNGDEDLNAEIPDYTTNDAATLEFEFVALKEEMSFNYIFASEEYLEWVGSEFNDIFSFFLSGPGINGAKNIALVPGTDLPVSINTVNDIIYDEYFIENPLASSTLEFDGYTTVLAAEVDGLIPCSTYKIKLAIADAGDYRYDSAVFLEANSFDTGNGILVSAYNPMTNGGDAYEGCNNGYFIFERDNTADLSNPLTTDIHVLGNATPGTDYAPLPSTITIPAGQQSIQIPVEAFRDKLTEDTEQIIVRLTEVACDCIAPVDAVINILDGADFNIEPVGDISVCAGETITLVANVPDGPLAPYTYDWSDGFGQQDNSIQVTPMNDMTVSVTVENQCQEITQANYNIIVTNNPPDATISPVANVCETDDPIVLTAANAGGTWSGIGVDPQTGVFDPILASNTGSSPYNITYEINNACGASQGTIAIEVEANTTASIDPVGTLCTTSGSMTLTAQPAGGQWEGAGIISGANTSGAFDPQLAADMGVSTAKVSYTPNTACAVPAIIHIPIRQAPTATISGGGTICSGETQDLTIFLTGTAPWQVSYKRNGANQGSINIQSSPYTLTVNQAGSYELEEVTDAHCTTSLSGSVTVNQASTPNGYVSGGGISCEGNPVSAEISFSGTAPWVYVLASETDTIEGLSYSNTKNLNLSNEGEYKLLVVKDANGCEGSAGGTASLIFSDLTITDATVSPASCGLENGTIENVDFEGGQAPFTWKWSQINGNNKYALSGGNENSYEGLAPGKYEVEIEDGNGCKDTRIFEIIDQPAPNILDGFIQTASCQADDGSITLISIENRTADLQYQWLDESGNVVSTDSILMNVGGGNYELNVQGTADCTASYTFEVGQQEKPTVLQTINFATTCGEANGKITTPEVVGGTAPYNFAWEDMDGNVLSTSPDLNNIDVGEYRLLVTDQNNCTGTYTTTIDAQTVLTISGGEMVAANCEQADGKLWNITIADGQMPYQIEWLDVSGRVINTTPNLLNVVGGAYTLVVVDANNCEVRETFSIPKNNEFTIQTANIKDADCGTDNGAIQEVIIENGISPISYQWIDQAGGSAGTESAISELKEGNYVLEATDSRGCVALAEFTVNRVAELTIEGGNPVEASCGASNGAIGGISVAGGTTPYDYKWYDEMGDVVSVQTNVGNIPAGNYSIIVTDANNCAVSANFTINETAAPTIEGGIVKPTSCEVADGSITAITVTAGEPPYIYTWKDESGNVIHDQLEIDQLEAGNYQLIITDAADCQTSKTFELTGAMPFTVNEPIIKQSSCGQTNGSISNLSITGGQAPFNYEWQDETGTIISQEEALTAAIKGNYTLIITDAANCQETQLFTITEKAAMTIVGGIISDASCGQANGAINDISIEGNIGNITYEWQDETGTIIASTAILTEVNAGNYQLIITDEDGCSVENTYKIGEQNAPTITEGSTTNALCGEEYGKISNYLVEGGLPPYTYQWIDEANGATIANTLDVATIAIGNYRLEVTDANGCQTIANTTISIPTAATLSIEKVEQPSCGLSNGAIVDLVVDGGLAPFVYEWTNEAGDMIATTATITDLQGGTYQVKVTDANGCESTTSTVLTTSEALALSTPVIQKSVCGTANGAITDLIITQGNPPFDIIWRDQDGTTVGEALELAEMPAGAYSLQIEDANGCSLAQTFTIEAIAPLEITAPTIEHSFCGQANGAIYDLGIEGGTSPYQFIWTDIDRNKLSEVAFLEAQKAGTYFLTIKDANDCEYEYKWEIESRGGLNIPEGMQIIDATCGLDNGSVKDITINGANGELRYLWEDQDGNIISDQADLENLAAGKYYLTATDEKGCQIQEIYTIRAKEGINIQGADLVHASCGNNNGAINNVDIEATATALLFTWRDKEGNFLSDLPMLSNVAAGTYTLEVINNEGCRVEETFNITDKDGPKINGGSITNIVCGEGGAINDIEIEGGAGAIQFAWMDDNNETIGNTADINALAEGNYTLQVTDENGCSSTTQYTIESVSQPTLTEAIITNAHCNQANGSIEGINIIGGTEPFSIQWLDQDNQEISNELALKEVAAGNYRLMIMDANGCAIEEEMTINNQEGVSISGGKMIPTSCGLANGSITEIDIIGGTAPYQVEWKIDNDLLDNQQANLSNLAAGKYELFITDAKGCQAYKAFEIETSEALNIDAKVTATTCGQANGSINNISIAGGQAPYQYEWKNTQGEIFSDANSIDKLTAGSYTLILTDAAACQVEATYEVVSSEELNIKDAQINAASCEEANGSIEAVEIIGGLPPFTYHWRNLSNDNLPNTEAITQLTAGTYQLKVVDATGCEAMASFDLPNEKAPSIVLGDIEAASCGQANGQAAGFTIDNASNNANITYQWLDAEGTVIAETPNLVEAKAGDYQVIITDDNGCQASTTINIPNKEGVAIVEGNSLAASCGQQDGRLEDFQIEGGMPPYSILWTNEMGTVVGDVLTITDLAAGTYHLSIIDDNGCKASTTAQINNEDGPQLTDGQSFPTTCGQDNGRLVNYSITGGVAPYNITWKNETGAIIANTLDINQLKAGTYFLEITDANGCLNTTTATITTSNTLDIQLSKVSPATCGANNGSIKGIEVVNATGELTYEWTDATGTVISQERDLTDLAPGEYFLKIRDENDCQHTNSFTIVAEKSIQLNVEKIQAATCGTANGAIELRTDNELTNWTFTWTNSAGETIDNTLSPNQLLADDYLLTATNGICTETLNIEIPEQGRTEVYGGKISYTYCNASSASITDIQLSNENVDLEWFNEAGENIGTAKELHHLSAGIYTLMVTDENGCQSSLKFEVEAHEQLLSLEPTQFEINPVSCNQENGSITWSAPSGMNNANIKMTWMDATGNSIGENATISRLKAGEYTLAITFNQQCKDNLTLQVDERPAIEIAGGTLQAATCNSSNGSITDISITGENSALLTYRWENMEQASISESLDLLNVASGTYTLFVQDEYGCQASQSFEVSQREAPNLIAEVTEEIICGRDDANIQLQVAGGKVPFSFKWSHDETINADFLNNLSVGTYTITVTDANNCTATTTVEVKGRLAQPSLNCETVTENSITFQWDAIAAADYYELYLNDSLIDQLAANQTDYIVKDLAPDTPINLAIKAFSEDACQPSELVATTCQTLPKKECPERTFNFIDLPSKVCITDTPIELKATTEGIFTGKGITNQQFDPTLAGIGRHLITWTITTEEDCTYEMTAFLEVIDIPNIEWSVSTNAACVGEAVTFEVINNATDIVHFDWQLDEQTTVDAIRNYAQSKTLYFATSGIHTVTLNVDNGYCTQSFTQEIAVSEVKFTSIMADTTINAGQTVQLTATTHSSYGSIQFLQWYDEQNNEIANEISFSKPTNITAVATDDYGCEAIATVNINVIYPEKLIIPTAFSPNRDGTNDLFRIPQREDIQSIEMYVYDRWGKMIYHQAPESRAEGWDGDFQGQAMPMGTYVYKASIEYKNGRVEQLSGNIMLLR